MNAAYTLGRVLIPLLFLVEGVRKLINVDAVAKMLADSQVVIPEQIAPYLTVMGLTKYQTVGYAVAAVEIICGLMIMAGLAARWGALILVVFTAATIFFVHHFWDMSGDAFYFNMTEALKNLSILGGLLLVVAVGSGPTAVSRD